MENIFYQCESLKSIDLSSFNTKKVENMNFMFFGCKNLNYIDLDTFNTENVRNMNCMFGDCSNELKIKIKIKYRNIKEEAFK